MQITNVFISRSSHRLSMSRVLEWQTSLTTIMLGLVFMQPDVPATLSSGSGGGFLNLLAKLPATWWGTAMIAVGITRIVALYINGRSPRGSPLVRIGGAILGVVLWSQILASFYDASLRLGHILPGVAFVVVLLAADMFSVGRSVRDFTKATRSEARVTDKSAPSAS